MNGIGSHQSARMGTDIWLTPRFVLDALGEFDLDPCSAPNTEIWPTAREHITLPRNGLREPWCGRVWLNPPYGREMYRWVGRLADHGNGVALIFARTETAGFVKHVWSRADGMLFLHGRLTFHTATGALPDNSRGGGNSGAPSVLVAYGRNNVQQLADAVDCGALVGSLIDGWRTSPIDPTLFDIDAA